MLRKNRFLLFVSFVCLLFPALIFSGCANKDPITYCGELEENGPWANCNPDRYDIDGPAERLLDQGVSKIIIADNTMGGPRFSKTFDVVQMTKRAMVAWEKKQADASSPVEAIAGKIGVILVVHGGFKEYTPLDLFDASVNMFSYDPNHPVTMLYAFNKNNWNQILSSGNAAKEQIKYAFEYERLGGVDPFNAITASTLAQLSAELDTLGEENNLEFVVDWACWMCGGTPENYAFPRYLYTPNDYELNIPAEEPATPIVWINDASDLMERTYPTEPKNWTRSKGMPDTNPTPSLDSGINPVAEDQVIAQLHMEAIEASLSSTVADKDTGVLVLNHAIWSNNETFDPKIDDTLTIIKNMEQLLLTAHPDLDPDNIVGAYMGVKEENPENGRTERTRPMRGENLGHAYLYESDKQLPSGKWGYRYWDALEYLKNRGVKHIVVGFTHIVADSVLNLVEIPNQIGKEIGYKNWLYWPEGNNETYPGVGHPFTDYWGNWVETECDGEECCFEMGGCEDGGTYPPPRQTPLYSSRGDEDPSLAYDVCEYGHLGYDPLMGAPDPNAPVQDQYTGTWAMYRPPNDDVRLAEMLAKHVLTYALQND